jgi:hypothetical protein
LRRSQEDGGRTGPRLAAAPGPGQQSRECTRDRRLHRALEHRRGRPAQTDCRLLPGPPASRRLLRTKWTATARATAVGWAQDPNPPYCGHSLSAVEAGSRPARRCTCPPTHAEADARRCDSPVAIPVPAPVRDQHHCARACLACPPCASVQRMPLPLPPLPSPGVSPGANRQLDGDLNSIETDPAAGVHEVCRPLTPSFPSACYPMALLHAEMRREHNAETYAYLPPDERSPRQPRAPRKRGEKTATAHPASYLEHASRTRGSRSPDARNCTGPRCVQARDQPTQRTLSKSARELGKTDNRFDPPLDVEWRKGSQDHHQCQWHGVHVVRDLLATVSRHAALRHGSRPRRRSAQEERALH